MKFTANWIVAAALIPGAALAVEVKSSSLAATLDDKARGEVTRIVTAHGAELAPAFASSSLFRIKITRTDNVTNSVWITAADADTFTCETVSTNLVRLVYGGFKEGVTYVTCAVQGVGDALKWGISAQIAPGWALEETEYPRLLASPALGSDGGDDRFVCGTAHGGVVRNPGGKPKGWRYGARLPGGLAAQFASVYDDRAGLCFAAEDVAGYSKYIGVERVAEGLLLISRRIGLDSGLVEQPYAIATTGFECTPADPCTWQDAADIYRAWAGKQSWCAKWFRDRTDVPAWMRDAPAIARFSREWLDRPDDIRAWVKDIWKRAFVPSPLLALYSGWEKRGTGVMPDCFPVRPDNASFASLTSDLRAEGVHAFLQPYGYHWTRSYMKHDDGSFEWDDSERFERIGHSHSTFNRNGSRAFFKHEWLRGGTCACLCGGDPWTRQWWNDYVCMPLAALGCDVIQFNARTSLLPCWNAGHGHSVGVGLWQQEALRDQLRTMRETMLTNGVEAAVVGVTGPCEFRNALVGIQDYHSSSTPADEWASVFSYLYHEYVPLFQTTPGNKYNRVRLAHAVADGQMPVILPSSSDMLGSTDAMGDFVRRWVAFYHGEGREWLAFGRQVKPPRIVCAMQRYYPKGKGKSDPVMRPTVFCNAFVSAEGRKAMVLVNATEKPQSVALYKGGARVSLELAPAEIKLLK